MAVHCDSYRKQTTENVKSCEPNTRTVVENCGSISDLVQPTNRKTIVPKDVRNKQTNQNLVYFSDSLLKLTQKVNLEGYHEIQLTGT